MKRRFIDELAHKKLREEFLFLTRVAIKNGVIKTISKISLKPVDLFDC